MAAPAGPQQEELTALAQVTLSLRWLFLALVIAQEALGPSPVGRRILLPFFTGILAYTLASTLYGWRYPDRVSQAARWAIPFDTAAVILGMQFGRPIPYLLLGYPVSVVAGLLGGHLGASLAAAAVGVAQLPAFGASTFAPNQYAAWGTALLTLLGAANAGALAAARLGSHASIARRVAEVKRLMASAGDLSDTAAAVLSMIGKMFLAHSGSLMIFDPQTARLEMLAAHHIDEAHRQTKPRLGEGIAGWVVQEGRPVLLTPDAAIPFPLSRADVGSSMCIPLATGGRPLGILNLNRATHQPHFTSEDLNTADLVAQQTAGLLLRAQHERMFAAALSELADGFGEVSRALSRDPAVLWPVLLDLARSLTAAPFAILALEREDTGTVDIVATRGIHGAAAREFLPTLLAASTDGQLHFATPRAVEADRPVVACVPLRVASRPVGAIGIARTGDVNASRPLLFAVAAHVAAAVHTARTAYRVADLGVVEERRRIAREMHDGLAQTLADALLQTDLSMMEVQTNPTQLASDLKELRTLLERAMRELREFMTELRRRAEMEGELPTALEGLGKEFERRYQIGTSVAVTGDEAALPSAIRHAVLAVVRQSLTNVRSHAQATAVTITANVSERECSVRVADNGVGFDLDAFRARPPAPHRLGLTSMEERAALVGGRLEIETAPGQGTTVSVYIPLGRDHG